MKLYKKLKNDGIKKTCRDIYEYQIDKYVIKVLGCILKNKPLQDVIVIESHNDFDSNGGAFYEYLIKNDYNKKNKIVWLLKHPDKKPATLPPNVVCVPEYKPSLKKCYYMCIAKWFSYDQDCVSKLREEQKSIFMTHGAVGMKNCVGLVHLPKDLDYCLTASEWWKTYDAKQFLMQANDYRLKICGYPVHDVFYKKGKGDLNKLINNKIFNKVVIWMPTFRKSELRNDSNGENVLGVPLLKSEDEFLILNQFLQDRKMLMIIKIHPKQSLKDLKIFDCSNIKVLTGLDVKKYQIDNYRLMKDVDAIISDYSSVAYDFLHVNKPIAYDLSDLDEYKLGIIVDDPHEMMGGHEITKFDDMLLFIDDISENRDPYEEQRKKLFNKVFKYHDGNSTQRVVELLGIEKY